MYAIGIIVLMIVGAREAASPVQVSAGAFWKRLPSTVLYEGTIPVVYETEWFSPNVDSVGNSMLRSECRNTIGNDAYCEWRDTMGALYAASNEEFMLYEKAQRSRVVQQNGNGQGVKRIKKRSLDFIGDALDWCCGVATEHKFESMVMDETDVRKRVQRLQDGLTTTLKNFGNTNAQFTDYQKQVADAFNMTTGKIKQLQGMLLKNKDSAMFSEELQDSLKFVFEGAQKTTLLLRMMRNNEILAACQAHHLPYAVVGTDSLVQDLRKMETKLAKYGQELAISVEVVSRYYQSPLSDCVIAEERLMVTLRIPTRTAGRNWELFKLITVRFAWRNDTCIITNENLYLAATDPGSKGKGLVKAISGAALHQCRPYHDKLCYVPKFSNDFLRGPQCAEVLFRGAAVERISRLCPLHCHPTMTMTVTEIGEETYVITHPTEQVRMVCPVERAAIPSHPVGAVQVTVPCNCKVVDGREVVIGERFPCPASDKSLEFTHIIPATWTNLQSFVLNPTKATFTPTYENLDDCLNLNWTMKIPYVNMTTSTREIKNVEKKINEKLPVIERQAIHIENGHYIVWIWNSILSALILYLLRKQPVLIGMTLPMQVRAEGRIELSKEWSVEITMVLLAVCLLLFIVAIMAHLVNRLMGRCRGRRTGVPAPDPQDSPQFKILIDDPKGELLPNFTLNLMESANDAATGEAGLAKRVHWEHAA